ncbi:MAG: hypothetical protein Q7K40_00010 [bacterium]|nr:hypothetical protein [bacterium]
MDNLETIRKQAANAIKQAPNAGALVDLERAYLGRAGELTLFFKTLKNFQGEERKILGDKANKISRINFSLLNIIPSCILRELK